MPRPRILLAELIAFASLFPVIAHAQQWPFGYGVPIGVENAIRAVEEVAGAGIPEQELRQRRAALPSGSAGSSSMRSTRSG
jgi:hypothetical protein